MKYGTTVLRNCRFISAYDITIFYPPLFADISIFSGLTFLKKVLSVKANLLCVITLFLKNQMYDQMIIRQKKCQFNRFIN